MLLQSLSGRYPDESVCLKFGTRHALRRRCGFQRKLRLCRYHSQEWLLIETQQHLAESPRTAGESGEGMAVEACDTWHFSSSWGNNCRTQSCCWWKTGQISQRILDSVSLTTTVVCDTVDTGLGVRVCGKLIGNLMSPNQELNWQLLHCTVDSLIVSKVSVSLLGALPICLCGKQAGTGMDQTMG